MGSCTDPIGHALDERLRFAADPDRAFPTGELLNLCDEAANMIDRPRAERDEAVDMVRWAYSKLHHVNYSKQEDALMLDRMKFLLEFGA